MKKIKNFISLTIIGLLLVGVSFFLGMNKMKSDLQPEISSSLISNKILSAKELITIKYQYTNMGQFENQSYFYGWKVPFTRKRFIVTYDGTINAGVDLENLDIKIDGKNINIKVPKSKILAHEIDEKSIKVFDEENSIFNPIKIDDYKDFSKDQKEKMEKDAIKKGLLKEADEKTKAAIEDLLNTYELLKDFKITVTN
ncbi:DUF4230 domain-containing protein [uncultured Peptoniphilus sp.]|uniref:DUF4230 domain-containing protein n=1 Tax=uncultured Peptoniphilus sp. TaxID=254354 RepID=UPI002803AE39|nr:DUF4230 domain-containing protein [uncultured Peptoniphilus sp.]